MKKDELNGKDVFDKVTGLSHELTNRVLKYNKIKQIKHKEMQLNKEKEEEEKIKQDY